MTELINSSDQTSFSPIIRNADNKDEFHGLIAAALFRIGSERVTINDIHQDPDTNDSILGSLLEKNLVFINTDQSLSLTKAGEQAIDKKIAIVYPFGPNSSIKGYNDTIRNMTDNGLKAFVLALTSEVSILKKVPKATLTNLFTAMLKNNIFAKLTIQVIEDIQKTCNDILYTNRALSNTTSSINSYIDEMSIIEDKIRNIFSAKIREIGSITLKKHVNFQNKGVITHIVYEQNEDVVVVNVTDNYGDVYVMSLEEIPVSNIQEISEILNI